MRDQHQWTFVANHERVKLNVPRLSVVSNASDGVDVRIDVLANERLVLNGLTNEKHVSVGLS